MIPELKKLSTEEMESLIKAPLLVSILIAGADGNIDRDEINGAISTAKKKAKSKTSLQSYYESVSEDFEDKLKVLMQNYPSKPQQRAAQISEELSLLNPIFEKVQGSLAIEIYDSLLSLALNIAKSSGGFFGLSSVGEEESKFVKLEMIKPPAALH
jgi:hypothetical protein